MRLAAVPESITELGAVGAARYWAQKMRAARTDGQSLLTLTSRQAAHPMVFRTHTTDLESFYQVFLLREFAPIDDLTDVGLVVDCGSNAGYSAVYFLNHFPGSTVVALEPEPSTFAVLERNLEPYHGRYRALNYAVWSHPARLTFDADSRAAGHWGVQVREVREGEPGEVEAVDVPTILSESGLERISLLKVDIEGAEAVVFGDAPWLDRVDNIVVELHDNTPFGDAHAVFAEAIAHRGYNVTQLAERTICRWPDAGLRQH
jgi:FkbM family methyltransferase